MESFAPGSTQNSVTASLYLSEAQLIDYCTRYTQVDEFPLDAISQACAEANETMGPSPQYSAVLCWLGIALQYWEQQYPLDNSLTRKLRQIRPLLTLCAVTDADFLVPGEHPLHQLMDTLQNRAVGWQPQLGRAGKALERLVDDLVAQSQQWVEAAADRENRALPDFNELKAKADEVAEACKKDRARIKRMVQRVVDSNQGRIKANQARHVAADFLNELCKGHQLPLSVIKFLHGSWYDSLQLIALKHGSQSEQWKTVSDISHELIDSVSDANMEHKSPEAMRKKVFEAASDLPVKLKKWVVSLQHDSEATADAVGLVELAHLQLMKKQEPERGEADTLHVESTTADPLDSDDIPAHINDMALGDWFELQTDSGRQRVQLALRLEKEQQLLFVNQAGVKTVATTYREFEREYRAGAVEKLANKNSFSLSLAWAAGISDQESYDKAAQALQDAVEAQQETEHIIPEAVQAEEQVETKVEAEQSAAEQAAHQAEAAEEETRRIAEEEARRKAEKKARRKAEKAAAKEAQRLAEEEAAAKAAQRLTEEESAKEAARQVEQAGRAQGKQEPKASDFFLAEFDKENAFLSDFGDQDYVDDEDYALIEDPDSASDAGVSAPSPALSIYLPMGSWLGFHDFRIPMLARLAVHDMERDHYIFVNRDGIKLRELSGEELAELVEQDLVDIIETRSSFRDSLKEGNSRND
ncbi:MAG: hypothetical protein CSA53_03685 [Gammaproteobacteria bacterium]|nr:MAG: hypothetical protein CSA53_03685 [Gammaproteobacteria bacterium]